MRLRLLLSKTDFTYNISLAQELFQDFISSTKFKVFVAKIKLVKAFNSINRASLLHRLETKGFPQRFLKWVSACISDVKFSIILNGEIHGYFNYTIGLRQGCLLSPLLFTVAMDCFSNFLDKEVNLMKYQSLSIGECRVSYLLFADDLLALPLFILSRRLLRCFSII